MPNLSRTLRFVISITELMRTLSDWEKYFFFYKEGLVDAVKVALSTFKYPTQYDCDYGTQGVIPLLQDFELYLESLERNNALFTNYADIWDMLELAASQIDEAIYNELQNYLGDVQAIITDVSFINKHNDCLIVVEY